MDYTYIFFKGFNFIASMVNYNISSCIYNQEQRKRDSTKYQILFTISAWIAINEKGNKNSLCQQYKQPSKLNS